MVSGYHPGLEGVFGSAIFHPARDGIDSFKNKVPQRRQPIRAGIQRCIESLQVELSATRNRVKLPPAGIRIPSDLSKHPLDQVLGTYHPHAFAECGSPLLSRNYRRAASVCTLLAHLARGKK
jgi:hypothetical protein